jgi:hypothetical protein
MYKKAFWASSLLISVATIASAQDGALPRSASPAGANVYIISPADGEIVSAPFTVKFGLQGMGVAPAGVQAMNTGHHHMLIDVTTAPPAGVPLPANDQIRHFGAGQTETVLNLPPGEHTLQLVLGDYLHIPHDPPVQSARITVHVKAE